MTFKSPFSLETRRVLVTGASGGIGSAISKALYSHGATITLSGTKIENLEKLKVELESTATLSAEKQKVHIIACDLSIPSNTDKLIKNAQEDMEGLDILINNAGITRDNLLLRMKDEEWAHVLDVNLTSCFYACRAAIKGMMAQRRGRIINISSVVGVSGNPGQSNYCASKAGMIGFSKALAQEVATRNITVNCIAPGFITSSMTENLSDAVKERILKGIPMQHMGTPEDIAYAALYLASSAGKYVTGQTLHVNGGMLMV